MAAASSAKASLAVVELLMDRGADIHAQSTMGFTPLIWAAKDGSSLAARRLVDAGADMNYQDRDGWDALSTAVHQGVCPAQTLPCDCHQLL